MFDVMVVGARCAGSPTAMLLARKAYRVLLVDRATFPSDTASTHFIWPPGVACLKRWGLLERVLATNSPVIRTIGLDLGEFQLTGELPAVRASLERHLSDALGLVGDFAEPSAAALASNASGRWAICRISFVNPMGVAGHWSGTPAITRVRSWHRAFLTRSARQNGWRMRPCRIFRRATARRGDGRISARSRRAFRADVDLTCGMAALEPPQPEMLALYQALRHNSVERDRYFGTLGGTVPIPEFYARENVRWIIGAASV